MKKQNKSEKDLCLVIQGVENDENNQYYIQKFCDKWQLK